MPVHLPLSFSMFIGELALVSSAGQWAAGREIAAYTLKLIERYICADQAYVWPSLRNRLGRSCIFALGFSRTSDRN